MPNIFRRLSEVLTANIHELIDQVEDPQRMISHLIREMEDNVVKARHDIIEASVGEKRLHEELTDHIRQSQEWLERAEHVIQSGRRDLARTAVGHKKAHDEVIAALEPAWQAAKTTTERLKTQLLSVQAKLSEAKQLQTVLAARQRAAEAQQNMEDTLATLHSLSSATQAAQIHTTFSQAVDKIKKIEARAKATAEMNQVHVWPQHDFQAAERERAIEQELDQLEGQVRAKLLTQQEQALLPASDQAKSENCADADQRKTAENE